MPNENTQNGPPSGPVAKIISLASAKFVKSVKQREARSSFLMKSSHSVESSRGCPLNTRTFIQALQALLQNHLVTGFAGGLQIPERTIFNPGDICHQALLMIWIGECLLHDSLIRYDKTNGANTVLTEDPIQFFREFQRFNDSIQVVNLYLLERLFFISRRTMADLIY